VSNLAVDGVRDDGWQCTTQNGVMIANMGFGAMVSASLAYSVQPTAFSLYASIVCVRR
jgi:hypothetical protein